MQSAWLQLATFECHVSPGLVRIRELGTSLPRSPAASGWLAGCPACLIYQQNLPDGQSLSLCDLPARRVVPFECSSAAGIWFAYVSPLPGWEDQVCSRLPGLLHCRPCPSTFRWGLPGAGALTPMVVCHTFYHVWACKASTCRHWQGRSDGRRRCRIELSTRERVGGQPP